jgi:protease-4
MSLSADSLLDRVKLKAQVKKWRTLTIVVAALLAFSIVAKSFKLSEGHSDSIARVAVEGIIFEDNERDKKLEDIKNDKKIQAVILYVNSPGGTIVGSESLYLAIRDIAEVKPVVAILGDVAASGGYMTAIGADYILARSGTITGSIGVMLQSFEITELAKKLGVNFVTFKSGELKGSPSPTERVTPKVESVLNESIKDSYNFFVDLVKSRRMLSPTKISEITDGRIFTGRQAEKNKLIDGLGGEKEALLWLEKEKNINTKKLPVKDIDLEPEELLIDKLYTKVMGSKSSLLSDFSGSGIMALWNPSGI